MALMESIKIPLGMSMPSFQLPDAFGDIHKSAELRGSKGLLVVFTCNHCPYAQALWPRIIRIAHLAEKSGINTVAINPNIHPDYPDDAPEAMKTYVKEIGIPFPYLVDETQEVARSFQAQCTPDLYLYDGQSHLAYHGRVDDSWKDEKAVTKEELLMAIQNLIEDKEPVMEQKPAMGCSIKWKN